MERNFLGLFCIVLISALTGCSDLLDNDNGENNKVAMPFAVPGEGAVYSGTEISLMTFMKGAVIYYTTNNMSSFKLYFEVEKPKVTETTTLMAFARKSGMNDSDMLIVNYSIASMPPVPPSPPYISASPEGGTVVSSTTIKLYTDSGAAIYYTTNGDTPTISSSRYSETNKPRITESNNTLKAIAVKDGLTSALLEVVYTVTAYSGPIWTVVTNPNFGESVIRDMAYGNGKFVAVGDDTKIRYSSDGITWTAVSKGSNGYTSGFNGNRTINAVTYGGNKFVAGGGSFGDLAYSFDGINWTAASNNPIGGANISVYDISYGNGTFVAVGGRYYGTIEGKIVYSSDGITWTEATNTTFGSSVVRGIAWGNGKFVAVGYDGKMAYSSDGITWTAVADSSFGGDYNLINDIAYGDNQFIAVGRYGKMASSSDGVTWIQITTPSIFDVNHPIMTIAYGGSKFIIGGHGWHGKIMAYSSNGISWEEVPDTVFESYVNGIVYGDNKFVIGGGYSKGLMAYSDTQ
jgi:hypothetical protein